MTAISKRRVYAMYKGDDLLCFGTSDEICKQMNIKKETFWFYLTKTYNNRIKGRDKRRYVIQI